MFLNDDDLTSMRADQGRTMPSTAIIKAPGYVPDGMGGFDESYVPVAGGTVPVRVDPVISSQVMVERIVGKETLEIDYKMTFAYDAPLAADHRIVYDGKDYEIVAMNLDHSWRIARTIFVSRATN